MAVEIITQNDAAVLEARVTVTAVSMPLALERAERELGRYCAGVDKAPAVLQYLVETSRDIDGKHMEYTLLFGDFTD